MHSIIPRAWVINYWNGRSSLTLGLGGGILGLGVFERLLNPVVGAAGELFLGRIEPSYIALGILGAFYALVIPIVVWWSVGTWRAAKSLKPAKLLAPAAKMIVCIVAVLHVVVFSFRVVPQVSDAIYEIEDDPEWGERGVRLLNGGGELEVYGNITRSVAATLARLIQANPTVRVVSFNSLGGRTEPALEIQNVIRSHGLDTLVDSECSSACTIAFLGGKHRRIGHNGRMGFHGVAFGGQVIPELNENVRAVVAASGVSTEFTSRAFSLSRAPWYPSISELRAAHIVTDEGCTSSSSATR